MKLTLSTLIALALSGALLSGCGDNNRAASGGTTGATGSASGSASGSTSGQTTKPERPKQPSGAAGSGSSSSTTK